MNKDAVYVMKSQDKTAITIILMNTKLPVSEKVHKAIDSLKTVSDLIFVFSDRFSEFNKGIDIPKFTNLYEGSFIVGSGQNVIFPVLEAISYSVNIFKCRTIVITDIDKLDKGSDVTNPECLQKFTNLNASSVINPILSIDRQTSKDLFEIYHTMDTISGKERKKFWKFWEEEKKLDEVPTSPDRKNSLYQSSSQFIFLRGYTARILFPEVVSSREEGKEEFDEYVKTFSEPNLNYFFASIIKTRGMEYIDGDFLNINFNGNS
jgi:hypothetical protein